MMQSEMNNDLLVCLTLLTVGLPEETHNAILDTGDRIAARIAISGENHITPMDVAQRMIAKYKEH